MDAPMDELTFRLLTVAFERSKAQRQAPRPGPVLLESGHALLDGDPAPMVFLERG